MRFLAAIMIGALLGTGAVIALVHDNGTVGPTPVRAVFQNLVPYKPPPLPPPPPSGSTAPAPPALLPAPPSTATRTQFNFGSGG